VLQPNHLAHLVLVNNPPQHAEGDFVFEDDQLKNAGARKLTFSGVGVYHPELFAHIVKGQPARLAPLLHHAIDNNRATAQYYSGVWHDIGTPERLDNLDQLLKNNTLERYV